MNGPSSKTRKVYVDAPTGQVHCRWTEGDIPLILCHQSPSSSVMFERVYPLLEKAGVKAIGIDTPGFGMSDVPDPRPSIATYAGVIPYVMDHFGLDRCAVLGHHTGAANACEFAATHPERVSHLILNGPPVYTTEERQALLDRPHSSSAPQTDGSHLMNRWKTRTTVTVGWTDIHAMNRGIIQTLWAGDTEWYGHRAAFEYDMMPRYMALTTKTLILTNSGDDIVDKSRRARDLRPDFGFVELEGGTHDIVDEQPEAWTAAVVDFVTS